MPQFDFFSFFTQTFWLSFAICTFYLIYLKFLLTKSSEVFKMRNKIKNFFFTFFKTNTEIQTSSLLYSFLITFYSSKK